MKFHEYEDIALLSVMYPKHQHSPLIYPALGLTGESGEVAEEVKKMIRDDGGVLTEARRARIVAELGDVLWYVTALASELGSTLGEVAATNVAKLQRRRANGTVSGEGSDR
jgi:NTP pyrophosphatase (non-canonical NTP hydrolase)